MSCPAHLPIEIQQAAHRGELQKVVKWLRKGGLVDAFCPTTSHGGQPSAFGLLHTATASGQLEMVRMLLKRGASIDLPSSTGVTALMNAAGNGHLSSLLVLLQHSANPDLQDRHGRSPLMVSASEGQEACVKALLRAKANTELRTKQGYTALQIAEARGRTTIAELIRQHAAPQQPAAAAPAAASPAAGEADGIYIRRLTGRLPEANEPTVSPLAALSELIAASKPMELAPAPLPIEINASAQRGELQKVVKWLRKGGEVDAFYFGATADGRLASFPLLHTAASFGHLEMAKMLLKRGASVDLPTSFGVTPLMSAANNGHLLTLLVLLQYSANPDLQDRHGMSALMMAAGNGRETCVKALLRAKANTELLDNDGYAALQWAEGGGHTATANLIRQHIAPPPPAAASPAAPPDAGEPMVSTVPIEIHQAAHRVEEQDEDVHEHRVADLFTSALHLADTQGHTVGFATLIRQHVAPLQPVAAVAPEATQAAQVARADAAMDKLLAEEAADRAKVQARSRKSKEKKKAGRAATAAGDEPSEAPPVAAPASLPAAAPKPVGSAAERAETALRVAIAGGGLSALEVAIAAAPREVRASSVGMEARTQCDRLLEAQQEAEREAKQGAAAEAARLAAAERVREVAARDKVQVGARAATVSKAREEAVAAAAAAAAAVAAAAEAAAVAAAKAEALERAMAEDGEHGSSGVAGPSEGSEAAEVPDGFVCPITAEIMTDPVSTSDGFTYERAAISEWLLTKDTSPFTGAKLESKKVIPNLSLRSMIRSFVEAG